MRNWCCLHPAIVGAVLLLKSAGHAQSPPAISCVDVGASSERAASNVTQYEFNSVGHVVDASGVAWIEIPDRVLSLHGTEPGCWSGGLVDGPYDDTSVYECAAIHCPAAGCPTPCLAYHGTACVAPHSTGGLSVEDLECAHYGDGISRGSESGDVVVRHVHFHDLQDDAIEDDYGLSNTHIFGSLIDGAHDAFGDRQRSSVSNDAKHTEWEVRSSLVRVRPDANPFKQLPGHGGFWKADPIVPHQHRYRITDNVFVAQGTKQSGILFPVVGYVDECRGNVLLWAGPISGPGGWLAALADEDGRDYADGLTDGERLAALNAAFPECFRVVLKAKSSSERKFLAKRLPELGGKSWNQRVAEWIRNTAPEVTIEWPPDEASVTSRDAASFEASACDAEEGDVSAAIVWTSSLDGWLGSGPRPTRTNLTLGAQVVTASVIDSGGRSGRVAVALTVISAPPATTTTTSTSIGPTTTQTASLPTTTTTTDPKGRVLVCHKGKTIHVKAQKVARRLAHGDSLGPCANCYKRRDGERVSEIAAP